MVSLTDPPARRGGARDWRIFVATILMACAALIALLAHLLYLRQPFFMDEIPILLNHRAFMLNFSVIPEHAKYPTFFSYVSLPGTAVTGLSEYVRGDASSFSAALNTLFFLDPDRAVLPARMIALACLAGACVTLWSMTRRFGNEIGMICALSLFAAPGLLEYGSYALPEALVILLASLCLKFLFEALDCPGFAPARRCILAAAFTAGLAISTKYNAAPLLFAIATTLIVLWRQGPRFGAGPLVRLAALSGFVVVFAFLIGSPGWVLHFDLFFAETIFEVVHAGRGHLGHSGIPYLGQLELLVTRFPLLSAAALFGVAVWSRTGTTSHGWVAAVLIAATIMLCAQSEKQSIQYLFPMVPALIYFAAHLWQWLIDRLGQDARLLASLILLALGSASLSMGLAYAGPNTTRLTEDWLATHVSADHSIALDWAYGPRYLSGDRFAELADRLDPGLVAERKAMQPTTRIRQLEHTIAELTSLDVDFIVVNQRAYGRFFEFGTFTRLPPAAGTRIADDYWQKRRFYAALFASKNWQLVFSAESGNGPQTLVFARSKVN